MADDEEKDPLYEAAEATRRSALNARDRALTERFLARDKAAEQEMVDRLNSMGKRVALYLWRRLYLEWNEVRGEYFATLYRYREEGKLRLNEPLIFLAQRLLKQTGRKLGIQAHRDQMALSFQGKRAPDQEEGSGPGPEETASWAVWLEAEATASMAAEPRFENAEKALGSSQQLEWLTEAASRLLPGERETFNAELAVAKGEHESLAAALGVKEGTAYNRRSAMRASLRRLAEEAGETDIVELLETRMQGKSRK